MIDSDIKQFARLQAEFEELPVEHRKKIHQDIRQFMDKPAGRYVLYQLSGAYFRMLSRAASIGDVVAKGETRDYFSGRAAQAQRDCELFASICKSSE